MKLAELIKRIIETRVLTPALEKQIDELMWSELNQEEIGYLAKLTYMIEDGFVQLSH